MSCRHWIHEGKILNDLLKATQSTLGCNIWQIWLCKAHGLIIQAVADSLNVKIYIVESNENFTESTIINPINSQHGHRTIYLGHENEVHYVSTVPCTDSDSLHPQYNGLSLQDQEANAKRKHNEYHRKYWAQRKRSSEEKQKQSSYMRGYRQKRKNTEISSGTESNFRHKRNADMREYR